VFSSQSAKHRANGSYLNSTVPVRRSGRNRHAVVDSFAIKTLPGRVLAYFIDEMSKTTGHVVVVMSLRVRAVSVLVVIVVFRRQDQDRTPRYQTVRGRRGGTIAVHQRSDDQIKTTLDVYELISSPIILYANSWGGFFFFFLRKERVGERVRGSLDVTERTTGRKSKSVYVYTRASCYVDDVTGSRSCEKKCATESSGSAVCIYIYGDTYVYTRVYDDGIHIVVPYTAARV